jgi:hypothetical protein
MTPSHQLQVALHFCVLTMTNVCFFATFCSPYASVYQTSIFLLYATSCKVFFSGISDNMLFSFEPTPEYLSEKLKRPTKTSSGVYATEKIPRRTSQDKKEGPGAARARAESASVGRSKWENAEETQVGDCCCVTSDVPLFVYLLIARFQFLSQIFQAVKHAEEEKNIVREEKKRKAREERAKAVAEAEAAAAAEAAADLQRRTRRINSKEPKVIQCEHYLTAFVVILTRTHKDADASTSSTHVGVGAGVATARSGASRKKWDEATETQVAPDGLAFQIEFAPIELRFSGCEIGGRRKK